MSAGCRAFLPLIALTILAPTVGCQTTTQVSPSPYGSIPMPVVKPAAVASPRPPRVAKNDPADPCAMRMQDIVGQLLTYFVMKGHLPATLDELPAIAEIDADTNYTCPVSAKPYVYRPEGLVSPGGGANRLILYDATPTHFGHRWGIVWGPPKGNQQLIPFVIEMSEPVFQTYHEPAPQALPPPPATGRSEN